MPAPQTVFLITGANRGIGLALVKTVLNSRPNCVVFAGVRDVFNVKDLDALVAQHSNLHVLKITSGNVTDNAAAVEEISRIANHLDVVIANAGILTSHGPIVSEPIEAYREHFEVNTIGPLVLLQAVYPLLKKSPSALPHFSYITTIASSIGLIFMPNSSVYGSSKAAFNFIVASAAKELAGDGIVTSAIHPGLVATDMGNAGVNSAGLAEAPVSPSASAVGILKRIEETTLETSGKVMWNAVPSDGGEWWDIATDTLAW